MEKVIAAILKDRRNIGVKFVRGRSGKCHAAIVCKDDCGSVGMGETYMAALTLALIRVKKERSGSA